MVILVTAFEPFGFGRTNGSWEAVRGLAGKYFGNARIVIGQLPVVWGSAADEIRRLVRMYRPIAIVGFGQAGSEPVRLEKTARNSRQILTDNKGWIPSKLKIYADGPRRLATSLPFHLIQNNLRAQGIPAKTCNNAGGYLCNEAFYTLMHDPGTPEAKKVRRGFIHVPPLNARVKKVRFDRKMLQRTAEIVIETIVDPTAAKTSKKWSFTRK